MSEVTTPVVDRPVLMDGANAVEAEGPAQPATTTTDNNNGGPKETNGQDVTMAGLEDAGVKTAKNGADQALNVAPGNNNNATTANPATGTTTASSSTNPPTPNRTSTPTGSKETVPARLDNNSSRAASAAPADRTADRVTMPTEPATHGAPTRQYLNTKVTYHVMDGMKMLAKEQPADPLRVLGEFLLQRNAEVEREAAEGAAAAAAAASASATEGDKKAKENGGDNSTTTEQ